MKKTILSATRVSWQGKPVPSACEALPAPVRPACAYLTVPLQDTSDLAALLLCDPLTGLVAYPSFEAYLVAALPTLAPDGVHLAIGDVDDLRGYVTTIRADDPTRFGHLAGNDCMRRVGAATCRWSATVLDGWPFAVCATFGGDEVIVVAAGQPYAVFLAALGELITQIRTAAPRACSFAAATTVPMVCAVTGAADAYRRLVSHVDACLFRQKAVARRAGRMLDGVLVDVGAVDLGAPAE